jgi:hypothetical protein
MGLSIAQFKNGCKKSGLGAGVQEYLVLGDRHGFSPSKKYPLNGGCNEESGIVAVQSAA